MLRGMVEQEPAQVSGPRRWAALGIAVMVIVTLAVGVATWRTLRLAPAPAPAPVQQQPPRTGMSAIDAAHLADTINPLGYVGVDACARCHDERVHTFKHTHHYATSRLPGAGELVGRFEPGRNELLTRTGLRFVMTREDDGWYMTALPPEDADAPPIRKRIDLVVGSGKIFESYLYFEGDELFQMPVGHLAAVDDWANAPGYRDGTANFERAIIPRCLDCHATWVDHVENTTNTYNSAGMMLGIGCERCHGPADVHIAYHDTNPDDTVGRHIIAPASLPLQRRLEMCAQCHGDAGQLIRPAFTYKPGEPLSAYVRQKQTAGDSTFVHTANQIQRLTDSPCFQGSGGFDCITCHDTHEVEPRQMDYFIQRCLDCHQREHCGMAERLPDALRGQCIDCHMPDRGAIETLFHTREGDYLDLLKMTEHRIAVHRDAAEAVRWRYYAQSDDPALRAQADEIAERLIAERVAEARRLDEAERPLEALLTWRQALDFAPDDPELRAGEQAALTAQMRHDQAKALWRVGNQAAREGAYEHALELYAAALELHADYAEVHRDRGYALYLSERYEDAQPALARAVELAPQDAMARYMLGRVELARGRTARAIELLRAAVAMHEEDAAMRVALGEALLTAGQWQAAAEQFTFAAQLQPDHARAHQLLGMCLTRLGRTGDAVASYRRAVELAPDEPAVLNSLAWLLATHAESRHRHGADAVRLALHACELTDFGDPSLLDTLAAAYAEAGQFDQAVQTITRAITMADATADRAFVERMRGRLALYEQRRAYRSP